MVREKSLLTRVTEVEVNALENPPELIANNPLGKIPCLLLDDGQALFDSTVINDYLNVSGNGPDLFAAHQRDWAVKKWQATSQGLLDVAVQLRIEKTKPEAQQNDTWMTRNRNAILRTVHYLQSELAKMPEQPCFLGLHLHCALAYLDFRHPELLWRDSNPKLAAWFNTLAEHPSLVATLPR
jgi:glutathione S-transferase